MVGPRQFYLHCYVSLNKLKQVACSIWKVLGLSLKGVSLLLGHALVALRQLLLVRFRKNVSPQSVPTVCNQGKSVCCQSRDRNNSIQNGLTLSQWLGKRKFELETAHIMVSKWCEQRINLARLISDWPPPCLMSPVQGSNTCLLPKNTSQLLILEESLQEFLQKQSQRILRWKFHTIK